MNFFWELKHGNSDNRIIEGSKAVCYSELESLVCAAQQKLPESKQLVALVAHNSLAFVIYYLALLRNRHAILLLDANKSMAENQAIAEHFQANLFIDKETVTGLHARNLEIADALALLLPTSGSTGSVKRVKLTFENLAENTLGISQTLPISAGDKAMTSLPLSYSFGLSILNTHLQVGAEIILGQESVFAKDFWQQFKQHSVNSFYGVPFSFEMLVKLGLTRLPLEQLKYMAQAGGRLSNELWHALQQFSKTRGVAFFPMYGQTEATARIAIMQSSEFLQAPPGTIGEPLPQCQLYIEDDAEQGELCFSGANIFCGYANATVDLQTCSSIALLKTGDIAKRLTTGQLQIIGRTKRIAKLEGRRLNLDELESEVEKNLNLPCVITSDDDILKVITCHRFSEGSDKRIAALAGCHFRQIKLIKVEEIPRLSNGKVDYHGLD
ncbi:AMP-binding protein [Pseudoalteromonas 'SMAR']|uniref:AMP-binding protein n=1 Tax=Pseudoalteromonas 'SMAR' TaxID=3416908 RepID=UPI003AF1FEA5